MYRFLYCMNTKFQIVDMLTIEEIAQQSQEMIDSVGCGNFSKTPQTYEELCISIAKILQGGQN